MLPVADLKTAVTLVSKGKIKKRGGGYVLDFADKRETKFKVSGIVLASAKAGDTFLVQVTAQYPKEGLMAARSAGFLEVLVVQGN